MRAFVLGVDHISGISKKSGNPYNITTVAAAVKQDQRDGQVLAGLSPVEMQGVEGLAEVCQKLPLPCWCEVETDVQTRYGKAEPIVTQITKASDQAKAA